MALALAVATKGPIALVLCGLALLVSIAVSAELRRRLLALHWVIGLVIVQRSCIDNKYPLRC